MKVTAHQKIRENPAKNLFFRSVLIIRITSYNVCYTKLLRCCSYPELGELSVKFDLVVNATSASLRGELPPVHTNVFAPGCLAYELSYGKGLTPFLRLAQGVGAGKLTLEEAEFDLNECVQDALRVLAPGAFAKNLELVSWMSYNFV